MAVRDELVTFKMGLHTFGYILSDALTTLTRGIIPASLISLETLLKAIKATHLDGYQVVIPSEDLAAYYSFELVELTVITEEGINVLNKIPLHYMAGKHRDYRATKVPQPIENGHTPTRFQLKDTFGEVTAELLNSHCTGSERLRFCTKPFAMSRSASSLCLSSRYFDVGTEILKLCPQIVIPLPENPVAEYLDDSTYLVTARSDDYFLFNHTHNQKETRKPIPGCRSCLVRP